MCVGDVERVRRVRCGKGGGGRGATAALRNGQVGSSRLKKGYHTHVIKMCFETWCVYRVHDEEPRNNTVSQAYYDKLALGIKARAASSKSWWAATGVTQCLVRGHQRNSASGREQANFPRETIISWHGVGVLIELS